MHMRCFSKGLNALLPCAPLRSLSHYPLQPDACTCNGLSEDTVLQDALQHHLTSQEGKARQHHTLPKYVESPVNSLRVLMRKARTSANAAKWHLLQITQTLQTQLTGKTVLEFPELVVMLPSEMAKCDVINEAKLQLTV